MQYFITLLQNKEEKDTITRDRKSDEGATMFLREISLCVDAFDRRHQKTGSGKGNDNEKRDTRKVSNV